MEVEPQRFNERSQFVIVSGSCGIKEHSYPSRNHWKHCTCDPPPLCLIYINDIRGLLRTNCIYLQANGSTRYINCWPGEQPEYWCVPPKRWKRDCPLYEVIQRPWAACNIIVYVATRNKHRTKTDEDVTLVFVSSCSVSIYSRYVYKNASLTSPTTHSACNNR